MLIVDHWGPNIRGFQGSPTEKAPVIKGSLVRVGDTQAFEFALATIGTCFGAMLAPIVEGGSYQPYHVRSTAELKSNS